MSEGNVTPIVKGFRQPPKPTKGQMERENTTLSVELQHKIDELTQRITSVQKFFGNMLNQVSRQSRDNATELTNLALWLGSGPTTDPAQKGDHLIMDFAGLLLNEDGTTSATVKLTDGEGKEVEIPDYFEGGSGKFFMLTNLGSGMMIPGFEEQLLGLKAGEGREVVVTFPENYGVPSLRNRKAKFTVYVHAINRSYANSPIGDLIDENARIRREHQEREVLKAQQAQAEKAAADAKAAAEAAAPAAEAPAPEGTPA